MPFSVSSWDWLIPIAAVCFRKSLSRLSGFPISSPSLVAGGAFLHRRRTLRHVPIRPHGFRVGDSAGEGCHSRFLQNEMVPHSLGKNHRRCFRHRRRLVSGSREEPSIQIGAVAAQGLSRLMGRTRMEERYLITSGASAGLAAAFNAPLAGTMFALEELHRNFSGAVLLPTMASAISATIVSQFFSDRRQVFPFLSLSICRRNTCGVWYLSPFPADSQVSFSITACSIWTLFMVFLSSEANI